MHGLALAVLLPLSAVGVHFRGYVTPRTFVIASVVSMLLLSFPQYDRSIDLLQAAIVARQKEVR